MSDREEGRRWDGPHKKREASTVLYRTRLNEGRNAEGTMTLKRCKREALTGRTVRTAGEMGCGTPTVESQQNCEDFICGGQRRGIVYRKGEAKGAVGYGEEGQGSGNKVGGEWMNTGATATSIEKTDRKERGQEKEGCCCWLVVGHWARSERRRG
jgi:hypothetical protein